MRGTDWNGGDPDPSTRRLSEDRGSTRPPLAAGRLTAEASSETLFLVTQLAIFHAACWAAMNSHPKQPNMTPDFVNAYVASKKRAKFGSIL